MPKVYAFHGTQFPTAITNYLAVVGAETMWPGAKGRKLSPVKDGTGSTILIVENNGLGVHWMEPRDLTFEAMDFRIDSPAGVSSWYKSPAVVSADGAVRRLSPEMPPDALRAALTVAGDENRTPNPHGGTVIADGRDRERKGP